uniref:Uncharacterized protein n=1 Tax=Triticum urartu TaxID=4572 RepID=A0A8R7QAS8_TRIUA
MTSPFELNSGAPDELSAVLMSTSNTFMLYPKGSGMSIPLEETVVPIETILGILDGQDTIMHCL